MTDPATGPFCAALGCRDRATVVVAHPRHGRRPTCEAHAEFPVVDHLEATA